MSAGRSALRSALSAAIFSRAGYEAVVRIPVAKRAGWQRTNFRKAEVTLLAGPAVVAGVTAALARTPPSRYRRGALIAAVGAGVCGVIDDKFGGSDIRGLRGHIGALLAGRLTTGGAKILGIGLAGIVGGALATEGGVATAVPAGLVVAAGANVANLFDLRPGRVAKLVLLIGPLLGIRRGPGRGVAAIATGAAAGLLSPDLGERAMLGDAGTNALGALLGVAAISGATRGRIYLYLAGLLAVTAASEVVSFSSIIDRYEPLRAIDRLGRLPDV